MAVNSETKIAIIGGGCAGISAAYYLKQKGYKHITLFEKEDRLGGKCCSIQYQDHFYDLGATLVSPSNTNLLKIIKAFNVRIQPQLGNHLIYNPIDQSLKSIHKSDMLSYGWLRSFRSLVRFVYLSTKYHWLKKPGYLNIPPELYIPFTEFIRRHQLEPLQKVFTILMTNMGYGKLEDIPAYSAIKFLKIRGVIAFSTIILTGKNYFKVVRIYDGFQSLWETVANKIHLNVILKSDIKVIEYKENKIEIHYQDHVESFDKLIIATPFDKIADKIPEPVIENLLIDKIEYLSYNCHLFKINAPDALKENIFVIPPVLEAGPIIIVAYTGKDHVYVSYSANELNLNLEELKTRVLDFICQFGVKPETVEFIAEKSWQYFPHVSIQAVQEGFYEKIHTLQGVENTYYTGGLLSFESVELCVSFSKYLIEEYF